MYYAVRVPHGKEVNALELLRTLHMLSDEDCFIPIYERTYRAGGKSKIEFCMLFPGYVLIRNTDYKDIREAQQILDALWNLSQKSSQRLVIKGLSGEDSRFIESILEDNVMKVSLLEMTETGEIKSIVGPLSTCRQDIEEVDFEKRAVTVKKRLFGKDIRIPFGIWSHDDPKTLWYEEMINAGGA